MYSLSGLPIIIGEFSARATLDDDGSPCSAPSTCPPPGPGMPTLRTQQERSEYYHKYLASVLGLPFGIGVHVSAASPSASSSDAPQSSFGSGSNGTMSRATAARSTDRAARTATVSAHLVVSRTWQRLPDIVRLRQLV